MRWIALLALFGGGVLAQPTGVRLKNLPMPFPGEKMPVSQEAQSAMPMQMGRMGMMQQCHMEVLQRLDRLEKRLAAIEEKLAQLFKEQEKESHERWEKLEEKMGHHFREQEKFSHKRLKKIEEKLAHLLKEREEETHKTLKTILKMLEHIQREQEEESHP